ncbi:MAG: SAM-dependent methyltransferase [Opitutaceae bacterium]|nr:SAM-dependent methyltransferase [Opitutaceae bacterium]
MSSLLHSVLVRRAAPRGWLRFDEFMECVLYDPGHGYYTCSRRRVGRGKGTDFFTATSLGPVFGELIVAACVSLLGEERVREATFVELGTEPNPDGTPGEGVLAGVDSPFRTRRTLPLGSDLNLEGLCVVFSNELFDAQPCRRFRWDNGRCVELGVRVGETGLSDFILPSTDLPPQLPTLAPDGYCLDLPLASSSLLDRLARQPWQGLFLAADYGKSWAELAGHTPQGTVRAYYQHRQSNDLLAHPGEQDLTCHVCWDWLEEGLRAEGFTAVAVESQEAFFIRHAGAALARIMEAEATRVSTRKLALMQLLHPSNMGQKFQFLHGVRQE